MIEEIAVSYLKILLECFNYDVEIFSNLWMYYLVFPAVFYYSFMWVKWSFLLIPVWMPVYLSLFGFKEFFRDVFKRKENRKL